jgi:hypothetical protein
MFRRGVFTFLGVLLIAGPAWSVDPGPKCEAAKLKEAGKYHYCRMKAESKAAKKSEAPDYGKCVAKFSDKWDKAESKGGGMCPTSGDEAEINAEITSQTDLVAFRLSGNPAPGCGNGTIDAGEQCDGTELGGVDCMAFGYTDGSLGCNVSCFYDLSGCACGEITCGNGTIEAPEQCDGADLGGATCISLGCPGGGTLLCTADCSYNTTMCDCATDPNGAFPATGQTTCWDSDGNETSCADIGQDGELQAGAPLRYWDNGDGTITDLNTGLMWEKKSDDESMHDIGNIYYWDRTAYPGFVPLYGNIFDWVDELNNQAFAGHSDWRIPNYRELVSILDLERWDPAVDPIFHTGCTPGCTVLTCSCTVSGLHWSSTTSPFNPVNAWRVDFVGGFVDWYDKDFKIHVRAVRTAP